MAFCMHNLDLHVHVLSLCEMHKNLHVYRRNYIFIIYMYMYMYILSLKPFIKLIINLTINKPVIFNCVYLQQLCYSVISGFNRIHFYHNYN